MRIEQDLNTLGDIERAKNVLDNLLADKSVNATQHFELTKALQAAKVYTLNCLQAYADRSAARAAEYS